MEGALIGVAVDAFLVRADTPVDQVVAFRDKNKAAIQRFRAAMTDLATALRQPEIAPEAALAAARDIYRNRIEADLGVLEDRLSESRIKFFAKSLFGAAALAMTPMVAPAVADAAARFGAQTINYRFSRERLLQEHPYAYLHRLSKADFVIPRQIAGSDLVSPDVSPRDFVYRHLDALFELMRATAQSQS
jgi:glutathione S-transferase